MYEFNIFIFMIDVYNGELISLEYVSVKISNEKCKKIHIIFMTHSLESKLATSL